MEIDVICYNFNHMSPDIDILTIQIQKKIITNLLSYIRWDAPQSLKIYFENQLTESDVLVLNEIISSHSLLMGEKNFFVETYENNKKIIETWYATNENNLYTNKVEETMFIYDSNKIIKKIVKEYYLGDIEKSSIEYNYFTDGNKIIYKKV